MVEHSTIRVNKNVKQRLAELGNVDDTYENIIIMLVDYYTKRRRSK